jgi:hypothetical protein
MSGVHATTPSSEDHVLVSPKLDLSSFGGREGERQTDRERETRKSERKKKRDPVFLLLS